MSSFDQLPRVSLCHQPTPIEHMQRLSEHLGINLYIKRDDCTGLAGGGNKTRKLEYLLGEARGKDVDTLITLGGIQSNHARQTAAAAAKYGFNCELVLEDVEGTVKQDYYGNGNVLLDKLFGANIHRVDEGVDCLDYAYKLKAKLANEGRKAFVIPLGGSSAVGSMGYVQCANEIMAQSKSSDIHFDKLVLATGSAGTQAGLLAGFKATEFNLPVYGICVSQDTQTKKELVISLLTESLKLVGKGGADIADDVITDGSYVGKGYGIHTQEVVDAINLCAQLEGILLDPVYTGKGMAGLIDYCQNGRIKKGENVLFIHTGGSQGLFAYREIF
ncbi:D-cysteine desulfhydrase [Marinomonas sp. PE14-40]|uniref:D-cysteine desulfhydrase n=1 Tax=Marinomonas sp. PE14-40 TaxID=3060621 RepID=UPI003F66FB75